MNKQVESCNNWRSDLQTAFHKLPTPWIVPTSVIPNSKKVHLFSLLQGTVSASQWSCHWQVFESSDTQNIIQGNSTPQERSQVRQRIGWGEREKDFEFAYICSHLQALLYHVAHLLAVLSEQEPMINAWCSRSSIHQKNLFQPRQLLSHNPMNA